MSDERTEVAPETGERTPLASGQALYAYAVARARGWRGGRTSRIDGEDLLRIRYRDLEAIVRPTSYQVPPLQEEGLLAHQRVVESAMRRTTVLPFPFGVVFRGRRQLIRLLQEQYLVLDEALSFFEGHWELRLHIAAAPPAEVSGELDELAAECYSELRRHARAAVPLPHEERRVLTAAFLVERSTWIEFVERADDLGSAHPELLFDVTGPWPPYDFFRISP